MPKRQNPPSTAQKATKRPDASKPDATNKGSGAKSGKQGEARRSRPVPEAPKDGAYDPLRNHKAPSVALPSDGSSKSGKSDRTRLVLPEKLNAAKKAFSVKKAPLRSRAEKRQPPKAGAPGKTASRQAPLAKPASGTTTPRTSPARTSPAKTTPAKTAQRKPTPARPTPARSTPARSTPARPAIKTGWTKTVPPDLAARDTSGAPARPQTKRPSDASSRPSQERKAHRAPADRAKRGAQRTQKVAPRGEPRSRRAETRFSGSNQNRANDKRDNLRRAASPPKKGTHRKGSHRPEGAGPTTKMRIAKAMARAGLCSRRDAERWIEEQRVKVNGKTIDSPALDVGPKDRILVDGAPLPAAEPVRLWRYYKPKGLVTSHKDTHDRPTVFDALPEELPRVVSIGRLDFNTEGLLLLTNDGALARHIELPATGWTRRYRVRARDLAGRGVISQERLDELADGIEIDGIRYGPIEASLDHVSGVNVWLGIAIREGKNREVRRVLATLDLEVNRLIRTSFGPFQLLDMKPGSVEIVRRRVMIDQLGADVARELGIVEDDGNSEQGAENSARPPRKSRPSDKSRPQGKSRAPRKFGPSGQSSRSSGQSQQSDQSSRPARKSTGAGVARPTRSAKSGKPDRNSRSSPAKSSRPKTRR